WLRSVKILLISTYELGRQPFGLASPAAWLRARGFDVTCADLSRQPFPVDSVTEADMVGFYLPMHTATRLTLPLLNRTRRMNPGAFLCCFGLYAPVNERLLRQFGADVVVGGEYEQSLCDAAERAASGDKGPQREPVISLERLPFLVPDRTG